MLDSSCLCVDCILIDRNATAKEQSTKHPHDFCVCEIHERMRRTARGLHALEGPDVMAK